MDVGLVLAWLLGMAVLVPLLSFVLILLFGPLMGKDGWLAGRCASGAILLSCLLSFISLVIWLSHHPPHEPHHGSHETAHASQTDPHDSADEHAGADEHTSADEHASADDPDEHTSAAHPGDGHDLDEAHGAAQSHATDTPQPPPSYYSEVYPLGTFGRSQISISIYIDALTICMFCMVSLIASCIHIYSIGYMADELAGEDYVDHEVTIADGSHLHRPGRYHRFFQFMSLFCFSMLGLVLSGNIAMTFVFWELVGICSYFLIGFYVERHSASTAANKAFIVNRVGDFGMIIGLMAIWGSLGTFAFGGEDGIFQQVRPAHAQYALTTPDGMVRAAAPQEVAAIVRELGPGASQQQIDAAIAERIPQWRDPQTSDTPGGYGRWLLIVAGIGIFCGCVGKSAQFPIHVWLPDAMEGPTPVSALVHSATMVAAGVFLVARFYPVFTPEVLLVIAIVGTITLFMAATIAITATDIKRVLAYSTVSQLGYMMLALGVGGWLAGAMHLITHAFFKSLLFLCSGSVIHAVHTNELPEMGGLRKKMPWTASTMLVGCLAIAGAGLPFALSLGGQSIHLGLSGYYSKDAILEQALSFRNTNPGWGTVFFLAAAGGAAITAFYMFRLWYLTFAGTPRNPHRYEHAHESPPVMYRPLVLLAVLAVGVAWGPVEGILGALVAVVIFAILLRRRRSADAAHEDPFVGSHDQPHTAEEHHAAGGASPLLIALGLSVAVLIIAFCWLPLRHVTLGSLLEQARPAGTLPAQTASLVPMVWPSEWDSHADAIKIPATWVAFGTALIGFVLATMFYGVRKLDPAQAQHAFAPIYRFLLNKWWFDELYDLLFVRPTLVISGWAALLDRRWIDGLVDGLAHVTRVFCSYWDWIADRTLVDGSVNLVADLMHALGLSLRQVQTGRLRQYVMFIAIGTVIVFALASIWR